MSWPTKVRNLWVRGLGKKDRRVTGAVGAGSGYFTFRHTELAQDQFCMHFILEGENEKTPRL